MPISYHTLIERLETDGTSVKDEHGGYLYFDGTLRFTFGRYAEQKRHYGDFYRSYYGHVEHGLSIIKLENLTMVVGAYEHIIASKMAGDAMKAILAMVEDREGVKRTKELEKLRDTMSNTLMRIRLLQPEIYSFDDDPVLVDLKAGLDEVNVQSNIVFNKFKESRGEFKNFKDDPEYEKQMAPLREKKKSIKDSIQERRRSLSPVPVVVTVSRMEVDTLVALLDERGYHHDIFK